MLILRYTVKYSWNLFQQLINKYIYIQFSSLSNHPQCNISGTRDEVWVLAEIIGYSATRDTWHSPYVVTRYFNGVIMLRHLANENSAYMEEYIVETAAKMIMTIFTWAHYAFSTGRFLENQIKKNIENN